MVHNKWVHIIIRALHELGGSAPYCDLKPEIERRAERKLTPKWRQTVEGTIEEFSSDSVRGKKPDNFKGSTKDVFRHVGHGHWALRDLSNPYVREALDKSTATSTSPVEPDPSLVFVREHWRRLPGSGESSEIGFFDSPLVEPIAAWCTNERLEVELRSGSRISVPLSWSPKLSFASPSQRSAVELSAYGLHWNELDEDISVMSLLFGPTNL